MSYTDSIHEILLSGGEGGARKKKKREGERYGDVKKIQSDPVVSIEQGGRENDVIWPKWKGKNYKRSRQA